MTANLTSGRERDNNDYFRGPTSGSGRERLTWVADRRTDDGRADGAQTQKQKQKQRRRMGEEAGWCLYHREETSPGLSVWHAWDGQDA